MHKFLEIYDQNDESRVYAFVEGSPDVAFYRPLIEKRLTAGRPLYIQNCDGKRNVYDLFARVIARYPRCQNILFFVDKDVDELIGTVWPADPRIFVTDDYSIENYLVEEEPIRRYFADFVRFKRISLDLKPILSQFGKKLEQFQRAVCPVMCWIIVMRRAGEMVRLSDLKLGELFKYQGERVERVRSAQSMDYIWRVTRTTPRLSCWREVRRVFRELERQGNPKRFTRGKFEEWFLLEFVRHVIADLRKVAAEGGGAISVTTDLHDSNFVPLLVRDLTPPPVLDAFLRFHLQPPTSAERRRPQGVFQVSPLAEGLEGSSPPFPQPVPKTQHQYH